MKKFISGFLSGAIIFSIIGAMAASYVANEVSYKIMVNGEEFVSETPALEVNYRTYLPLRAIGNALGVPVEWNQDLKQVEVGNKLYVEDNKQYSRNNPAPINTVQTFTKTSDWLETDNYTAAVRVMEIIRGAEAWNKIINANMFNDEAPDGYEYILARIAFSVLDTKTDFAVDSPEYDFDTFSSNNEEMEKVSVVEPEPQMADRLYEGGNTEGWITVMVRKDDPAPKIAYGLDYDGTGGIWFALYE